MKWWTFDNSCFICSHTLIIIPELNMQLCIKRRSTCCWFHNLVCFASTRQQKLTYPILTQHIHIQQIINQTSLNCISQVGVLNHIAQLYFSTVFLNCICYLPMQQKSTCSVLIISDRLPIKCQSIVFSSSQLYFSTIYLNSTHLYF